MKLDLKNIIMLLIGLLLGLLLGYFIFRNDTVYVKTGSFMENDSEDFVKNELIITLTEDTLENDTADFLSKFESSEELMDNIYVISLDKDFGSRMELNSYCTSLKETYNFIEYCEANNIIKLDDCSKGPC